MAANEASPLDELVRQVLEKIGASVTACTAAPVNSSTPVPVGAMPQFSGADLGDDANLWCTRVEELTKDVPHQRLSLATHALVGPAKKWYQGWEAQPCTWEKFREDLCAMFVSERKLHDRLLRALQYASDGVVSYAEYARTKLTYLKQTRVSFSAAEFIELIVTTITDPNVRQAMLNARYNTTSDLLVGISEYKKIPREKEEQHEAERARPLYRKRCYTCDIVGHTSRQCTKKPRLDRERSPLRRNSPKRHSPKRSPPRRVVTCTYCSKRGHEEVNCWAKRRATREDQVAKKPDMNDGKHQMNVCYSVDHKLTPVVIRDILVRDSLIDSGATCSLIKERVARRANCKINSYTTTIRGISDSTVKTVGSTTVVIEVDGLSLEVDLFVVPDEFVPYDLIVGKNVLSCGGLRMVTDSDGTTKLERVSEKNRNGGGPSDPMCCILGEVAEEARSGLRELLERHKDMIAVGSKVRCVSTGQIKIATKEDRAVSYHPYRLSISEREKVREIISELMTNGIIRGSTSSYASPIILVKKKNGEDRMCIDFRALNRITIKDKYPLPLIDDQLDRLGDAKYFTTLDMASGFYQIPIAEDSIEKTAFVTPDGHYEFLRMPFGLANAPAVFQRAINNALGNLRNSIALVYLDDVLIPSKTIEEGLDRLEQVLQALDTAGFSLNMKKCLFFKTQLEYLGREISGEGIRPGSGKIKALLEAPVPINVKQVRQFMGLASYFRKFVPEFASRASCITKLLRQNQPWCWGPSQENARNYILDKLSSKPLLIIFDPKRETELHTDASSIGYGAILFQRMDGDLRVVAYFSRRTTPEESRYHSYELETLAIVNALKYFRVYLLGIKFKIITDCNAIEATSTKRDLLPRIARWWIYLKDFTFDLEYRKGKQVEHVDYLSRNLYHDENCHVGHEKTYDRISKKYWFPKMRAFVRKYLDHCLTCIVSKRHTGPRQGLLHSIPKKCIPFHTIHCDCVGPFEISKDGYQHILVIVDAFTKYIQLVPLKTLSGSETLQVFKERLTLFGTPRLIVFDRGTNFTFKQLQQFIVKHGSEDHFIATGAPRANGQAERYVATVTNLLTVEIKKGTEWPNKLAKLMLTLNTTVQKTTGFSPSRLLFGLDQGPGTVVRIEEQLPPTGEEIDVMRDRDVAAKRLEENAVNQDARFNKTRRNNIEYKEGDTVFVKPGDNRRAKLEKKYVGPFAITKVLINDRYELAGKSGRTQIVPKDRLRVWKGDWSGDFDVSDEDVETADEPC
ncbi:PREDICTED: uncharacterized protein LOC107191251 [Dufourea novaeangliae]|uniref:uncharacterized protein LOC107191251 n=1 Tax=Dufourea novaeangliae TaxID=178035 RepID=UPI000767D071|nr:PREDICTED: uncharacterized protein LOC107191251 [Dufourea novaeangliae]